MEKMTVICSPSGFRVSDDSEKGSYRKEISLPPNTIYTNVDQWEDEIEAVTSEPFMVDCSGHKMEKRTKWTLKQTFSSVRGWVPIWEATHEAIVTVYETGWDGNFEPIHEYKVWRED